MSSQVPLPWKGLDENPNLLLVGVSEPPYQGKSIVVDENSGIKAGGLDSLDFVCLFLTHVVFAFFKFREPWCHFSSQAFPVLSSAREIER